ncbi:MAG: ferrochelatase, partial [Acidobacteriota bacterium]
MALTRHVVLATYGEPPTASFIDQLAYSWRILLGLTRKVAAIPRPVLPIIALSRARGRRALWRAHDYGSPLEAITELQATALQAHLGAASTDDTWRVHVGYEYRRPLVADVLAALPGDEAAFIVPLYAADSAFTHELTREAVDGQRRQASVLRAFAPDVLARASAEHVLTLLAEKPAWHGERVALVLAAHGTVLNPPTPIDTGLVATEALCNAIRTQLAGHFGMVVNGWLNHARGGQWTDPPIEVALEHVVAAGFTKVVYYPYGFLGDNAESELEGRLALQQQP